MIFYHFTPRLKQKQLKSLQKASNQEIETKVKVFVFAEKIT